VSSSEGQARHLLQRDLLSEQVLRTALNQIRGRPGIDLCQYLVELHQLTPKQAESVRAAVMKSERLPAIAKPSRRSSHTRRLEQSPVASYEALPPVTAENLESLIGDRRQSGLVGRKVGRYEIKEEISRGGMGVVLRAWDTSLELEVALKLMLKTKPGDKKLRRFQREARVLARLNHPGVVRVRDFGREAGIPFFTMDIIEGRDLSSLTRRCFKRGEELDIEWLRMIHAKVAEALAYCNENGVIHRDVKPANILVEEGTDRPVLVDFGLVKRDADKLGETMDQGQLSLAGEIIGTPAFMSPEQMVRNGSFGEVSPATDVWGLGATLFFCLCAKTPYDAPSMGKLYRSMLDHDPQRLRHVAPEVPADLEEICRRCMIRDSRKRPTLPELAALLRGEEYKSPNRTRADSADPGESPGSGRRGRRLVIGLVGVLLLLGGLGVGMSVWLGARRRSNERRRLQLDMESSSRKLGAELALIEQQLVRRTLKGLPKLLAAVDRGRQELAQRADQYAALCVDGRLPPGMPSREAARLAAKSVEDRVLALRYIAGNTASRTALDEPLSILLGSLPESPAIALLWAQSIYFASHDDVESARKSIADLLKRRPALVSAHLLDARLLEGRDRRPAAIASLARGLEQVRDGHGRQSLLIARASLFSATLQGTSRGRLDLLKALEVPLRSDDDRATALRCARRLQAPGLFARIVESRDSMEASPEHPGIALAQAWELLEAGHPATAIDRLGRLRLDGESSELVCYVHFGRGLAHDDLLEEEQARAEFRVALVAARTARLPLIVLEIGCRMARLDLLQRRHEQAMGFLKPLIQRTPGSFDVRSRRLIARLCLDTGRALISDAIERGRTGAGSDQIKGAVGVMVQGLAFQEGQELREMLCCLATWVYNSPELADMHLRGMTKLTAMAKVLRAARSRLGRAQRSALPEGRAQRLLHQARSAPRRPELQSCHERLQAGLEGIGKRGTVPAERRSYLEALLRRAWFLSPYDPLTAKLWRFFLERFGDSERAFKFGSFSYRADPCDPESWDFYARHLDSPKARAEALQVAVGLDQDAGRDPESIRKTLVALARTQAELGDLPTAIQTARRAVRADPNVPEALRLLVKLLPRAKDLAGQRKVELALRRIRSLGSEALVRAEKRLALGRAAEAVAIISGGDRHFSRAGRIRAARIRALAWFDAAKPGPLAAALKALLPAALEDQQSAAIALAMIGRVDAESARRSYQAAVKVVRPAAEDGKTPALARLKLALQGLGLMLVGHRDPERRALVEKQLRALLQAYPKSSALQLIWGTYLLAADCTADAVRTLRSCVPVAVRGSTGSLALALQARAQAALGRRVAAQRATAAAQGRRLDSILLGPFLERVDQRLGLRPKSRGS